MPDRPIALWTTPRSASTAFDRMMRARGDVTVLTEPFSVAYYFGPERRSDRFAASEPDATFHAVLADVMGAAPLFFKDMAYHLGPLLRPDVLAQFDNTFLIRDPRRALPSLHARWPDFTDDEAGYRALRRAFDILRESTGAVPPTIDATELRADPDPMVAAWCGAVGIEHRPDALTWEPGMPSDWNRWADWFDDVARSSGFTAPAPEPAAVHDPSLQARIESCRDDYLALWEHRLVVSG